LRRRGVVRPGGAEGVRTLAGALALLLGSASSPAAAQEPTFCVESIRQSNQGFERVTLFRDGTLVWKVSRDGKDKLDKHELPTEEVAFYCEFFGKPSLWAEPGDWRSMITAGMNAQALVVVTRPDGTRKEFRFDELSALSPEVSALRASLEGLKGVFLAPLAPLSRFDREALPIGLILRRFDGAMFRVRRVDETRDIIEIEGVNDPYTLFVPRVELRYQFEPPPRPRPAPTPTPDGGG
jgi:hypothetical protein